MSGSNPLSKPPMVRSMPSGTFSFQMDENNRNALFYCSLLALQFGLQPMIASKFTGPGVSKASVVIATEIFKILVAVFSVLSGSSATDWVKMKSTVTFLNSLKVAALPAVLYAIQNICIQYGYVLLDSMTFNLLNQTKTLSAAIWLYLLMDQKQSPVQMFALLLLLISGM
jgi:UDP-sugar transporter A1/2/3